MPRRASEIEACSYLRLLVFGSPKVGKSTTVLKSCIGSAYVINSDDEFSLRPALQFTDDFDYDLVFGSDPNCQEIEKAIYGAREGVKAGNYQTIIWDTITKYCWRAEEVFAKATENAAGEADGRRYHPRFRKHVMNIIDRLFTIPAHVIVNAHWAEVGGALIGDQLEKEGKGIAPMLPGQLRTHVPAAFQDVIFLEKQGENRVFVTSPDGVWGTGARNLPGVKVLPADISLLWEKMQSFNQPKKDTTK